MLLIGTIVRAITFQFREALNGITGWTFRLKSVRSSRSPPVLKLNCKRHADEAAQRILRFLGERVDVVPRCLRLPKGWRRTDADQRGRGGEACKPVHHLVDALLRDWEALELHEKGSTRIGATTESVRPAPGFASISVP